MRFESTRVDAAPDRAALQQAGHHAREACRLDPSPGEAWSTLAFVLNREGHDRDALAAARKAVALQPDCWRHYVRLAFVSWGDERLRAADEALALSPGLALAHWFAATVFGTRQAFERAIDHLRAGCAAQDAQRNGTARFHAVGLHLLYGLVLAAQGACDGALEEFARELALEDDGQVYARECAAMTWYACGALRLRQGRGDQAQAAFREALTRVPRHPLAAVGLAATSASADAPSGRDDADTVDAAMVKAAVLTLTGRHEEAARLCGNALAQAGPGPAGWLLPVDPLLHATADGEVWAQTLTMLAHRAT